MKKGLLVVCTMISILLQVVSFSFRSEASDISSDYKWVQYAGSYSGTVNITQDSSYLHYVDYISMDQYITQWSDYEYFSVRDVGTSGTVGSHSFPVTPDYFTGYLTRHYIRLVVFPRPVIESLTASIWVNNLKCSYSSFSGDILDGSIRFCYGSAQEVLSGSAYAVRGNHFDGVSFIYDCPNGSDNFGIWLVFDCFASSSDSYEYSITNVSCNYDKCSYMVSGNLGSIDMHLGDIYNAIQQDEAGVVDAIQDQTQEVTEGYDNSQIEQSNTQLADSMQDYDSQQSEITDQATGYIDDVAFVDPSSQVQLAAAITYSASWLQSLFVNLGDWGILVVVSLSLAFAFMLIGWYKYRK